MNLVTYRPVRTGDVFDRLFHTFFDGFPAPMSNGAEDGTLALDISEDDRDVIVRASLPGFAKDEVEVELHEGELSIKAQHAEETEQRGERFYRRERRVGSVSRRVTLPEIASDGEARAELRDGVLTVRVPRAKPETARKVRIN